MNRFIALSLFVGIAAFASASYELVLVADSGNATPGSSRVHRVDGTTGAYLGSFGGGFLQRARGVTIDKSTGRAYVSENGGGIHAFDYSTGVYYGRLDEAPFFDRFTVFKGGSVYATGGDLVRTNATTGVQTNIALPNAGGALWIADYSASEILVSSFVSTTSSVIYRYNVITSQFTAISGVFSDPSGFFGDATYLPKFGPTGSPAVFAGSGSGGDLRRIDLAANGQFVGITALTSANLNTCFGITAGHGGFFASGKLAADNTKGGITFFDNFGTERQTYTFSNLYDPRGMASVIAPEPGTMIAMGVGLAALVRRRRTASSTFR